MKKLLVLVLSLVVAASAFAENKLSFGFDVGINPGFGSTFEADELDYMRYLAEVYNSSRTQKPVVGFSLNCFASIPLFGNFILQPAAEFTFSNGIAHEGYEPVVSSSGYTTRDLLTDTYTYDAIDIPLYFGYKLSDASGFQAFSIMAGPYVSFITSNIASVYTAENFSLSDNKIEYPIMDSVNFGLEFKALYEYKLHSARSFKTLLGLTYKLDFTPTEIDCGDGTSYSLFTRRQLGFTFGGSIEL